METADDRTREFVIERLQNIFQTEYQCADLKMDTNLIDAFQLTSMKFVIIMLRIEQEFNIRFPDEGFFTYASSFGQLVDEVEHLIREQNVHK